MAIFSLLTTFFTSFAAFPVDVSGGMLFLLHKGEVEKAFTRYLAHSRETSEHDFILLQQATKTLLEQGITSGNPEIELMCMFGAGVSASQELLPILQKGIRSNDLKIQLIAISYLGKQQDDEADRILLESLNSPYLIVRLEALLQLAKKNHPSVMGHLQSLIVKVPQPLRPVFSQIAIHLEGLEATRFLRAQLMDSDPEVRIEALLCAAQGKRDDFLPQIRALACGSLYTQQECCAFALGMLKDYVSIEKLKEFAESKHENVKLVAACALYTLDETDYLRKIEELANEGSLFAICALGKLKAGKITLVKLLNHSERDVRLNATLALLMMHEKEALQKVHEILIEEGRDFGFHRINSPGGSMHAWVTIPSASQQKKAYPGLQEETEGLREQVLIACIEFDEHDFLYVADILVEKKQNVLIPCLMKLLENKKSAAIIHFLKKGCQKAGAPLVRNYCTLALYKLNEKGPYEEQLISWVKSKGSEDLIRFQEREERLDFTNPHMLTPEETSRFLIDACESLAMAQNQTGIEALIHAITYGNPKNRYALAGLLMRTTE